MKSIFQTFLAILPFLSLLAIFNGYPVDARMSARRAHSDVAKRLETGEMDLVKRASPKTFLAKAPHWVTYTLSDYSSTYIMLFGCSN